jgi:hypothetical protein
MENEASAALKSYFTENEMAYQIGTPTLPQAQCRWARHRDFQGTLCDRRVLSRSIFSYEPLRSHLASSRNNIELTADIKTESTTFSSSSFSWPD